MPGSIDVYTSIPPRLTRQTLDGDDIGMAYLAGCIASWRAQGVTVRSVHYEEERALITAPLEGVEYVFMPRSNEQTNKKPSIATLMAAMEGSRAPICAIINADILLLGSDDLTERLRKQAEGGLLVGKRTDISDLWEDQGSIYPHGYDLFVFDRSLVGKLPDIGMILGEAWWDYWMPLMAAFQGVRVRRVTHPLAIHLRHPTAYSRQLWLTFGRVLYGYIVGEGLRTDRTGLIGAFVAELDEELERRDPAGLDETALARFSDLCVRWIDRYAEPVVLTPTDQPLAPVFTPACAGLPDESARWPYAPRHEQDLRELAEWLGRRMERLRAPRFQELAHLLRITRALATGDGATGYPEMMIAFLAKPLQAVLEWPEQARLAALLGTGTEGIAVVQTRLAALHTAWRADAVPRLPVTERVTIASDAPLSRMAAIEHWDTPGWAEWDRRHFGKELADDYLHRSGWAWEHAQLLYGLRRLGRLDAKQRILVGVRLPDPLYPAVLEHVDRVDVVHFGAPSRDSEEEACWLQTSDVAALRRLTVRHIDHVRDSEPHSRYDAVLLPHNTLLADGLAGLAAMLEWAERRLAPGGILAFAANILLDRMSTGPWIGADMVAEGTLERLFAAHTGLAVLGPFEATVSAATLDRVARVGCMDERFGHFLERSADGLQLGSVWFLRKTRETGANGWAAFQAAWTQRTLGAMLPAMQVVDPARLDRDAVMIPAEAPAGLALFGPYIRLMPGWYRLTVSARAAVPELQAPGASTGLSVEVVTVDRRLLAWREVEVANLDHSPIEVLFQVSDDSCGDGRGAAGTSPPLEFLVSHSGGHALAITGLHLEMVDETATRAPIRLPLLQRLNKTAIGRRVDGAVLANADEPGGHLLFGPYLQLPAGTYRLTVSGACTDAPADDAPALGIEVVVGGVVQREPTLVSAAALNAGPVTVEFTISGSATDRSDPFEARLSHLGQVNLRINGVDLDGGPSWENRLAAAADGRDRNHPAEDDVTVRPGKGKTGFLLGLPRSGTTLLSVMLDNHPAVASPPEPWIMLALEQIGRVSVRHPANSQLIGTAVHDFCAGDGDIEAARAAADALYGRYLRATGKTLLIDKTPRYFLILDYLKKVFPDAPYVWILRDPFDVAASYRTSWQVDLPAAIAGGLDEPAVFDLIAGLDRMERFHAALGDELLVVRYERLSADPVGELARVLAHLGLPDAAQAATRMTDLGGARKRGGGFGDHKIRQTATPHTSAIGGWRTVFSLEECQILLDALGAERLRQLGYGDTVTALLALGVKDRGESVAAEHRDRIERQIALRMKDIARVSSNDRPLSSNVQALIQRALSEGCS